MSDFQGASSGSASQRTEPLRHDSRSPRVPTRKSIALCAAEGSICHVLAYFRDEKSANKAIETLRKFIPSVSMGGVSDEH